MSKNGTAKKPATKKLGRRARELEIARIGGKIEAIQESARADAAAFDPAVFELANDPSAWYALEDSFHCWSDDLSALFNVRKYDELRQSLRRLLLLVEAAVALTEKSCIESGPVKKGGEVS